MDNQRLLVSELGTFGHKNAKFGKYWILYTYTLGPQCKIFNYGLQEELMGAKSLADLGGGAPRRVPPPTGPDSFVLTCKIFET